MGVTVSLEKIIKASYRSGTGSGALTQNVRIPSRISSLALANGTGNLQVNEMYYRDISFTGTTAQTFDLTAISDGVRTVAFSKIKVLVILSQTTSYTDTLVVGNAASNQWTPGWSGATVTQTLTGPSPLLCSHLGAGFTVDGTNKSLKITPSATQTVGLFLAGLS